ncbi:uncharacterized protein G2W53_033419 [Senna tora]|uniref:Uncharacterized protein n=1 Tax=Senna tora TaxID=362788 RepID=A0A834SZ53_9FABA|nr:uncharacterized protein G2W53_033419 [Senna tora]
MISFLLTVVELSVAHPLNLKSLLFDSLATLGYSSAPATHLKPLLPSHWPPPMPATAPIVEPLTTLSSTVSFSLS